MAMVDPAEIEKRKKRLTNAADTVRDGLLQFDAASGEPIVTDMSAVIVAIIDGVAYRCFMQEVL